MTWWRLVLGVLALLAAGCSDTKNDSDPAHTAHHQAGGSSLPVITFTTGRGAAVPLAVEIADDPNETSCGLMHRTELPENQGMIFVFAADSQTGFWMRNTLLPLSIAFVAADGRIVDIQDMEPVPASGHTPYQFPDGRIYAVADGQAAPPGSTIVTYPPRAPFRYAIEVNKGWFSRHGIAVGNRVDLATVQAGAAGEPPPLCRERGI